MNDGDKKAANRREIKKPKRILMMWFSLRLCCTCQGYSLPDYYSNSRNGFKRVSSIWTMTQISLAIETRRERMPNDSVFSSVFISSFCSLTHFNRKVRDDQKEPGAMDRYIFAIKLFRILNWIFEQISIQNRTLYFRMFQKLILCYWMNDGRM